MPFLDAVYCTDEDIARVATADFTLLIPPGQDVAYGADGAISHLTPWGLSSASASFVTQVVKDGQVVILSLPATSRPRWWGSTGELFAVDGQPSSATAVNLRRVGSSSGTGQSPGGTLDLSGVTYSIRTFYPQIEDVSFEINREFGIDPTVSSRSPGSLKDQRELKWACVWQVLRECYLDQWRNGQDVFQMKYENACKKLDSIKARLAVRWTNDDQDTLPYFGQRVER